jgi:hypothetical protein
LVAFGGKGVIFVDGSDPDEERRFTLAHEVAHFLVDYWQPRMRAVDRLGLPITEVLDGLRSATASERLYAILLNAPSGVHTDLMDRDLNTDPVSTWQAEDRADKVALALLAPPREVISRADLDADDFEKRWASIVSVLEDDFGLPHFVSRSYGYSLLKMVNRGPSWVEALGLK